MRERTLQTHTIYRIYNTVDSKGYVGQTNFFEHRMRAHFYALKHNRHRNIGLQAAYNEHGAEAFKIEVLEAGILKADVNKREQFWVKQFNSFEDGYNRTIGGGTGYRSWEKKKYGIQ